MSPTNRVDNRVTITEIAHRSGVSKSAVSYALNNRPGLSEQTRERILGVAHSLGWTPNRTARLLSGSRTDAFGLVLARSATTLGSEPFFMHLLAGLEQVLAERQYALLLQLARDTEAEIDTYRKWWAERRVDAVVVVDLQVDDPRLPVLAELGMPAIALGAPSLAAGMSCVWNDDATSMSLAVTHLAELGHRRLARVAGPLSFGHTRVRDDAFAHSVATRGLTGQIVHADFSTTTGARATEELMAQADPPTAIVFDNDLMAVASVSALQRLGIAVPHDVSLIAWDDSELCAVTHPPLSAMSHDVVELGAQVARQLFALLDGAPAVATEAAPRVLLHRQSTAPPPAVRSLTFSAEG